MLCSLYLQHCAGGHLQLKNQDMNLRFLHRVSVLVTLVFVGRASGVSHKLCDNAVPGLDKMSHGIDITSFDLFSRLNTGLKNRVLQYTCDDARKKAIYGKTYDQPDQVSSVTAIPRGIYNSVTELIRTYSKARETLATSLGVSGSFFGKFGFSGSRSLKSMEEAIVSKSRYIERVSAFESAWRAHMIPDFALEPDRFFQYYIDRLLPADYTPSSDPSANDPYKRFIRSYGTHYFKNANFGGLLLMELQTSSDYYLKRSESAVKKQAQASFMGMLKVVGGNTRNNFNVEESFKRVTTATTRYYGGHTNLLQNGGIQKWQPTVSSQPWLFSGQLAPISNLIRNDSKRASMERAVTDYVLRAYLDELSRLLLSRLRAWTNGLVKLQQLQNKVTDLKKRGLLKKAEVETASDQVLNEVSIPRWFTEHTQLCYDWYPDGNGGQCSGPSRHLCAPPGLMTPEYRDDTDGRSGGCRMSWSLHAMHHETWFNQVQICFHWYADGDGGQCGGGAARTLCAPVNKATPSYRDDTDGRGGGCRMQWKLVVPESAPTWALNVELCYFWYPDGDGGQCGGGAARHLCALANSWTSYYRDDTDGRGGGCRQSWGIKVKHH